MISHASTLQCICWQSAFWWSALMFLSKTEILEMIFLCMSKNIRLFLIKENNGKGNIWNNRSEWPWTNWISHLDHKIIPEDMTNFSNISLYPAHERRRKFRFDRNCSIFVQGYKKTMSRVEERILARRARVFGYKNMIKGILLSTTMRFSC